MATVPGVNYNKTVLPNGLRLVTEQVPAVKSVAVGVWVNVGSRDENDRERGLTHFIEHMLFKGTRRRSAKAIAASIESLGGSINAFTSREQTCFHVLVLEKHLKAAVDVLSDILLNSTFTKTNIEREKQVVYEEIAEIEETPSDHIHDLFSQVFWRNQALGQPILGSYKSLAAIDRRLIKAYLKKHYTGKNIVISAAGNVSHRKMLDIVKDKFRLESGRPVATNGSIPPRDFAIKCFRNGSNQAHLCLGFPGLNFGHEDRFALLCLNTYLGGGMSSVLFQKVREDKGLAYTVYSFADFYRDSGVFGIYLATEKSRARQAMDIVVDELKKIKRRKLTTAQLDTIKTQIKGNLLLGLESTTGRMNRLGRFESLTGKYLSMEDTIRAIDRTRVSDIIAVANNIIDAKKMTITSLGPIKNSDLSAIKWA
jgi:predicted Zn-dependent peptidase